MMRTLVEAAGDRVVDTADGVRIAEVRRQTGLLAVPTRPRR